MMKFLYVYFVVILFKQKTAYEMRISDCSSDVCSSDLLAAQVEEIGRLHAAPKRISWRTDQLMPAPVPAPAQWRWMPMTASGMSSVICSRSEERRVGTEWVSMCISRWSPYH